MNNESPTVIDKIFKGLQFKKAIFEECNKFEWRTISTCQTRLRANTKGKAQIYLAQIQNVNASYVSYVVVVRMVGDGLEMMENPLKK